MRSVERQSNRLTTSSMVGVSAGLIGIGVALGLLALNGVAAGATQADEQDFVVYVPVALASHGFEVVPGPTPIAPPNPTPVDPFSPHPMPPYGIFWNCSVVEDYDQLVDGMIEWRSRTTYNELSQALTVSVDTGADGSIDRVSTYTYDEAANLELVRHDSDNDGSIDRTTRFYYDDRNRVVREEYDTDANGEPDLIVKLNYDDLGNLLERLRDADGDGAIDEIVLHTYVDGVREKTEYDSNADGRMDTRVLYEWDDETANRLVRKTYYDAPAWNLRATTEYSYDAAGRLVRDHDVGNSWVSYSYQEYGWLSKQSIYRDSTLHDVLNYTYDRNGRLLVIRYQSGAYAPYLRTYGYHCP